MRLFLSFLLLSLPLLVFSQDLGPVEDVVNNQLSKANSSARVAESQSLGRATQNLEVANQKIQKVIDDINVVSRKVSQYVGAAEEVVETGEAVRRGVEVYSRIAEDVPNMTFLSPTEVLTTLNTASEIFISMNASFAKVRYISLDKYASFADMDDGERIEMLRVYLEHIRGSVYDLESLYDTVLQKGAFVSSFSSSFASSMDYAVFDF